MDSLQNSPLHRFLHFGIQNSLLYYIQERLKFTTQILQPGTFIKEKKNVCPSVHLTKALTDHRVSLTKKLKGLVTEIQF